MGPFDDVVAALLAGGFASQNADGGLPETFAGDRSGCWTSAEILAAVRVHGLEGLCPAGAVERLEAYLVGVCRRHRGRGLPYYEVCADGEAPTSRPLVEASACLVMALRAGGRPDGVLESVGRWLIEAQAGDGGWGIGPGETPRTYSTAYAVGALDGLEGVEGAGEAVARGRRFIEGLAIDADGERGWPYRPGLTVARPLPTVLALEVLGLGAESEGAGGVGRFLERAVAGRALVEEDEFATRDGLKMSFAYAPRLVCAAAALRLCGEVSFGEGAAVAQVRAGRVDGILRAVALHEHRLRTGGRPVPELPETRLWHFIELAWGYGALRAEFRRRGEAFSARYSEHGVLLGRERGRRRLIGEAMRPVAELARAVWIDAETPSDRLALHLAMTETTCRAVRAQMAAVLMAAGQWAPVQREAARVRPGAGRTLWGLGRAVEGLARRGGDERAVRVAEAFAGSREELHRWLGLRNRVAHGLPTGAGDRQRLAEQWDEQALAALGRLAPLFEPPLWSIEEIGLPAGSRGFFYRARAFRGEGAELDERILESERRLPDRIVVQSVGGPGDGRTQEREATELRCLYAGDPAGGADAMLPLGPFAVRALCVSCSEHHVYLLEGAADDASQDEHSLDVVLCAARCATRLVVRWPWAVR